MGAFFRATAIGTTLLLASAVAYAAQQPAASGSAKQNRERLICKSSGETGSMARRRRQCFTQAQWDRINEASRKQTLDMIGPLPGNTGN